MRGALLSLLLAALGGCASTSQPCDQLNACPGALVCQVGKCAPLETVPVRPEARRKLLEPTDALYVDGHSQEGTTSEVRAGSEAGGGALILLRFEPTWTPEQVERAFLILEPVDGALPSAERIELTVGPIVEEWSSQRPVPLPRLGSPEARAITSFSPPRTARIEVTELVRGWARQRGTIHGLAVRTSGGSNLGGRFGWDDAHGTGPRLDLYLR